MAFLLKIEINWNNMAALAVPELEKNLPDRYIHDAAWRDFHYHHPWHLRGFFPRDIFYWSSNNGCLLFSQMENRKKGILMAYSSLSCGDSNVLWRNCGLLPFHIRCFT